jgi:hypothetical protein
MLSVCGPVPKLMIGLQIVLFDCFSLCGALFRSRTALVAENLFLRKQLALFQEREKKAKATTAADRFVFSKLGRLFDWRNALVIVQPATLIRWHPGGILSILTLEIKTRRETVGSRPSETVDPSHGSGKADLG